MNSIAELYQLEADKILADGKKVSLFSEHAGTIGAYREARLRSYLSDHVSGDLIVSSGFIVHNDPESDKIHSASSFQTDALVFEASATPLLKTSDFAVVEPECVAAVIEVKSNLKLSKKRTLSSGAETKFKDEQGEFVWAGTLVDALKNISKSIAILTASGVCRDRYFAGIMSYEATSIGQFTDALSSGQLSEQLGIANLDDLLSDICVLNGKWFGFSAYQWVDPEKVDPREGACKDHSFLLESHGINSGESLQLFTASLHHTIEERRKGNPHKLGGLRSARGFGGDVSNHQIPVASSRQHEV